MLVISTNPANIQSDLEKIEKWCHNNNMQLNASKCHILPIKVNEKNWHSFILNSKTLSNKMDIYQKSLQKLNFLVLEIDNLFKSNFWTFENRSFLIFKTCRSFFLLLKF